MQPPNPNQSRPAPPPPTDVAEVSFELQDSNSGFEMPDISLSAALTSATSVAGTIISSGLEASTLERVPESSFLANFKDPVYHLVGYSTKEVKAHFQEAWANDTSQLTKEMAAMKMGGRCLGFAASVAINITARAAAFTFALTSGIGMALFQFVRHPVKAFKDPHKAMQMILGAGAVGGVLAGAAIGGFGELLIRASLSIDTGDFDCFDYIEGDESYEQEVEFPEYKYQKNPFEKAAQDNLGPTILGTMLAAGTTCIYPAMWQLPFKEPKES